MNMHDRPLNKVLLSKDFTDFWISPTVIFILAARVKYTMIDTTASWYYPNRGCILLQMIIIRINEAVLRSLKFKGTFEKLSFSNSTCEEYTARRRLATQEIEWRTDVVHTETYTAELIMEGCARWTARNEKSVRFTFELASPLAQSISYTSLAETS